MNLSARAILECRQREGDADPERPSHTDEALRLPVALGRGEGRPAVEPPSGRDKGLQLGDSASYQHYPEREALLKPAAGDFLRALFEHRLVNSVADAAAETGAKRSTIQRAAKLHGIDISDADAEEGDGESRELKLPSGEKWPLELLSEPPWADERVLSQLLATDGMSIDEAGRYLSRELEADVAASELREAAVEAKLLPSGDEPSTPSGIDPEQIERRAAIESHASVPEAPERETLDDLALK